MEKEKFDIFSGAGVKLKQNEQEDKVESENPAYEQWMEYSHLTRSLMGGQKDMKIATTDFLPMFPLEPLARYKLRLEFSTLKNAFRKTVTFLSGQVFQADISFNDDFPEALEAGFDNIDANSSTLDVFSKRVFETGIANGVSHILVEAPSDEPGQTVQDDIDSGRMPYFKEIRAENVIGWQTNEVGYLEQFRFKELVAEKVGTFGLKYVPQIRVLFPGGWQTFRYDDKDFVLYDEGDTSIDYIPISTYMPGEPLSVVTAESPLQDLADLNLHHWRSFSDQTNILHVARVPILLAIGIDLEKMAIGASKAIETDTEGADMKYVEVTGRSIEAGFKDLSETESAMAIYGLQQMLPRTGNITATEKALTAAESNSNLATWVGGFEDALQRAVEIYGDYRGVEVPPDAVEMPLDFEKSMADATVLQAVLKAVDSRVISKQAAFEYINESGALKDGYTWEQVQEELLNEARDSEGSLGGVGGLFDSAQGAINAPADNEGEA